ATCQEWWRGGGKGGLGLLAPFLGRAGVAGVPLAPTAVIGGPIVGIERGAQPEPLRQVRVSQKLAAERDQVRPVLSEPVLSRVQVEPARNDELAAVFGTHQLDHL